MCPTKAVASTTELLATWYAAQCNGEWEHQWGVTIETLDNPGWSVRIDLSATELEKLEIPRLDRKTSESDWIMCFREGTQFHGAGDPRKLQEILRYFLELAALKRSPSKSVFPQTDSDA